MTILNRLHGTPARVTYLTSIIMLISVVIISPLPQLGLVAAVLTIGAISGPVAEYFGLRLYSASFGSIIDDGNKTNNGYKLERLKSILCITAVGLIGWNGVLFLLMFRITPPGDIDTGILIALMFSALFVNFVCWVFVRSLISAIDPKPFVHARLASDQMHKLLMVSETP